MTIILNLNILELFYKVYQKVIAKPIFPSQIKIRKHSIKAYMNILLVSAYEGR